MQTVSGYQSTIPELFESIEDAIKEVVKALGGTKRAAAMLWPAMDVKKAERRLDDCLNPDRAAKLDPDELKRLARWGREIGCHAIANYFCEQAGYAHPTPISPSDEKAELERRAIEAVGYMRHLVERAEAVFGKGK